MNFGDLPRKYSNCKESKTVVLLAPYDKTSTWMKGSDHGPKAIIQASKHLEFYDIETGLEVCNRGIFTDSSLKLEISPEEMVNAVHKRVNKYIKLDKFVVLVGGEHSVTVGSVKAHSEKYSNMSVLQLDAHTDLRDAYCGSRYNHACVMARVKEICPIVQVGIRSMDISELKSIEKDRIFYAKDIYGSESWMAGSIKKLSDDVYVTIDLDVFDPSVMPSTGTPEPGGLYWYSVLKYLKQLAKSKNIVGFDIVELCPNKANKAPDFLAAKLIYTLLSYVASKK